MSDHWFNLGDWLASHNGVGEVDIHARSDVRDRLFLLVGIHIAGCKGPLVARVRNLSRGGMLAEVPHRIAPGTRMQIQLPHIAVIGARCVWQSEGRFGVAFDAMIDPQLVRIANRRDHQLPPTLVAAARRTGSARRPKRPM